MRHATIALASTLLSLATLSAKPPLQPVDLSDAITVQPLQATAFTVVNGQRILGPTINLDGSPARAVTFAAWDSYGRDWGPGSTITPLYGNFCGLGSAARWWFGSGYNAPVFMDDMEDIAQPGAFVDEFDFSWSWESTSPCDLVVEFSNDWNDHCFDWGFFSYYGGFILSFGVLPGAPGTIYVTGNQGLSSLAIPLPNSPLVPGNGSYRITITDGSGNLPPGPTQPMLWTPKKNLAAPFNTAPYIEGAGSSFATIEADDSPTDGNLDPFVECYDYSFAGLCPTNLNAMTAFGITSPPCPPCPTVAVTKVYRIKGVPNGTPWTWGIVETPPITNYVPNPLSAHGSNSGVSTGTVCTLALALNADINSYSAANLCPTNALQASLISCKTNPFFKGAIIKIIAQVCPGSSFDLFTGNGAVPPTCKVPTFPSVGCVFNPEIVEIVLSGHDCNGNDQDDAIDIALEDSLDANANGIPDECGCPADFDHDGFVTGDDFDAFVIAFELGNNTADFDHNGFVTGEDFDAYVTAFETGC